MMIESLQNPKIKSLVALQDRKERNNSGFFLVEGYREILRAVESGKIIEEIYFCKELFLGTNEMELISASKAVAYQVKEGPFRKCSYRDRPDGLIAKVRQFHYSLDSLLPKQTPFYVVAESIEKPGNLGSILRSSDAAGVDGLIVCDPCTDIFNPNVVRSSVGTLFTVPVCQASSQETIRFFRNNGIKIVAATPSATTLYTDIDCTAPLAIAVGTEQLGLSEMWMDEADIRVKIPMRGRADSLNVAAATTLLLYEVVRQRCQ